MMGTKRFETLSTYSWIGILLERACSIKWMIWASAVSCKRTRERETKGKKKKKKGERERNGRMESRRKCVIICECMHNRI